MRHADAPGNLPHVITTCEAFRLRATRSTSESARHPNAVGILVSYSVLAVVALFAFVLGMLTARRRSDTKVIWEAAPQTGPAHDAAITDPQLLAMLEQKQLIGAIRRYRDLTGAGLKESKDAVEALQRSLPGT